MRDTELYAVPPLSTMLSPNLWYSSKAAQNGFVTLTGALLDGRMEKLREELKTEIGGCALTMAEVTIPYVPRYSYFHQPFAFSESEVERCGLDRVNNTYFHRHHAARKRGQHYDLHLP